MLWVLRWCPPCHVGRKGCSLLVMVSWSCPKIPKVLPVGQDRPSTFRMDMLRLCPGHLLTVFPPILDVKTPDLLGNSCCTGCCRAVLVMPALFKWYGVRMHAETDCFWEVYLTWGCPGKIFQLHRMRWQTHSGGFLFLRCRSGVDTVIAAYCCCDANRCNKSFSFTGSGILWISYGIYIKYIQILPWSLLAACGRSREPRWTRQPIQDPSRICP